jgi:hypothetical protein
MERIEADRAAWREKLSATTEKQIFWVCLDARSRHAERSAGSARSAVSA